MAVQPRSLLAAVVLLLVSFSAMAGGTATASIGNVRFGVLDLTPADGATPGFDILTIEPSLSASIYTTDADYYANAFPPPLTPAVVQLGLGTAATSARTDGTLADVSASAMGDASLGDYGQLGGSANQAVHFMLRPHSVLTIAGHLSTLATRSADPAEYYDVAGMAYVGIVDEQGYTFTQFVRQSLAFADWPDTMSIEDDFTLAFANGSAQDRQVSVYFQALTNVIRIATPVPEPSAVMLLAAGLLLLAARAAAIQRRAR